MRKAQQGTLTKFIRQPIHQADIGNNNKVHKTLESHQNNSVNAKRWQHTINGFGNQTITHAHHEDSGILGIRKYEDSRDISKRNSIKRKANSKSKSDKIGNGPCKIISSKKNNGLPSDFFRFNETHNCRNANQHIELFIQIPKQKNEGSSDQCRQQALRTPCFGDQNGCMNTIDQGLIRTQILDHQLRMENGKGEQNLQITLKPIQTEKNIIFPISNSIQYKQNKKKNRDQQVFPISNGHKSNKKLETEKKRLQTLPVNGTRQLSHRNKSHKSNIGSSPQSIEYGKETTNSQEDEKIILMRQLNGKNRKEGHQRLISKRQFVMNIDGEGYGQNSYRDKNFRMKSRQTQTSAENRQHRIKHKELQRKNRIYNNFKQQQVTKQLFPIDMREKQTSQSSRTNKILFSNQANESNNILRSKWKTKQIFEQHSQSKNKHKLPPIL